MANKVYGFDVDAIDAAVAASRDHFSSLNLEAFAASPASPELSLSGGCISVVTQNNQICVSLPFDLGSHCLPLPLTVPDGTAAQACIQICTKYGIPCGACVTIGIAGVQIVKQCYGCAC